jgi:hypothetical protein
MDPADTIETVRQTAATELDRLGSDKLLIAVTGGTLEPDAVRSAAVARERGVAGALERWAADESDGAVADAFAAAATAAAERADRFEVSAGESDALTVHFDSVDGTAQQVGAGLVATPLVADRFYLQVVNFFVNEPDEASADVFREVRSDASSLDYAREALAALSTEEREQASQAALAAIEAVYDEYATTLESMGLDPRPVC